MTSLKKTIFSATLLSTVLLTGCLDKGPDLYSVGELMTSPAPLIDKALALSATAATYGAGLMASCPDLKAAGLDIYNYTEGLVSDSAIYATEDGRQLTSDMMKQALANLGAAQDSGDIAAQSQACAVIKQQVLLLAGKINETKLPVASR